MLSPEVELELREREVKALESIAEALQGVWRLKKT